MASEKQIAANRENAKHCTGPRSEAGKARSSQNAFKTGIDAKSEVMACENPGEHDELIASFRTFYMPLTPEESSFVDALIRHEWLSRRYICVEAACWDQSMIDMDTRALGRVFVQHSQTLTRANRLYHASRRAFAATLKQLRESQARRRAHPEEIPMEPEPETLPEADPPEPPRSEDKPLNPKLVSFLQIHDDAPATTPDTRAEINEDPPKAA